MRRHFRGMPTLDDFELQSEPLRRLKENEILLKPEFWSVDPYARVYPRSFGYKLPITMLGSQVAEVLESRNSRYPVGSHVLSYTGWREVSVTDPEAHSDSNRAAGLPKVSPAFPLPPGLSRYRLLTSSSQIRLT